MTTLIPCLPSERAIGMVPPMIAPFEAAYAACPLVPSEPATLATFMITPRYPEASLSA